MIDYSLLVVDSTLQDYLVDKSTGLPLTQGIITFYQDSSRTTLKNVYYQSNNVAPYTYDTLPNPLTLSAVGTVVDDNGSDTKILYYPVSEVDNVTPQLYYVTVDNSMGTRQFTRQGWPINAVGGSGPTPGAGTSTMNLIANNVFWRNAGVYTANSTTNAVTNAIICPSQHDGMRYPEIQLIRSNTSATDVITFGQFAGLSGNTTLTDDPTPEFYMNINCTSAGSGETYKYIQIPIATHVENLSGWMPACATIQAMNNGGTPNTITLNLFQDLGTGATPVTAPPLATINLTPSWLKTTEQFAFPDVVLANVSTANDDCWYLQIGLPINATFNINIAMPSVYLNSVAPNNSFSTYDQAGSIISTPRTGDVKTSLNDFFPWGWVPMSGGTIGNASSNATARNNIDTWRLFNLLWNKFSAYTVSTTNLIAQMVNSSGSNVAYGGTAIADWNANNAITLTNMMGQVILGTVPFSALLSTYTTTTTASSSSGLLLTAANNVNFFNGMPVYFIAGTAGTLPTGLSASTIYYVSGFNGTTTFHVSTTFANAIAGTVISYTDAGTNPFSVAAALNGTYEGQYSHVQLASELVAHSHVASYMPNSQITDNESPVKVAYTNASGGSTGILITTTPTGSGGNYLVAPSSISIANSTPSGSAFNITQPGTFYNIYMKL